MFAQESEILSEVPAEHDGLCQADSRAREGPPGYILPQEARGGGWVEEQTYFGAQRRQAVGEERGTLSLL